MSEEYIWLTPKQLNAIKNSLNKNGVVRLEAPYQQPIRVYKAGVEFIIIE